MVNVSRRAHLSRMRDPFMPVPRMTGTKEEGEVVVIVARLLNRGLHRAQ